MLYIFVQGMAPVSNYMFVVVIFTLPYISYSLMWRISILEFVEKLSIIYFQYINFSNPQTSEPYNSIGHAIDSKSLVWISIVKSRFLALINLLYDLLSVGETFRYLSYK